MISILTSFFSNNIFKIVIGLSFVISLFLAYFYGVSNGVDKERARLTVEYNKVLEEKIAENTKRLTNEFNEKIKIEQSKIKKEYIYIEKKSKAKDIVDKSKTLNKEECKISDEEIKEFNKLTRKVK